ncbi:hypothetical protein JTB14_028580 [Gonioctena quinquepunctata]|nr:hypothetical protein JTB14_028580 [Gonioctena quinquepunctata]
MLKNARCQLRVNMPRTYERKTNRQSWSQESMERAIEEVLSGRMGYLKASNVLQSTLENRVKKAGTNQLTSSQAARKEANAVRKGDPRPQAGADVVLQVDPATEEKPAQRTCETVVEINKPIQTNIDEPFPNKPCCSESLEPQIFTDEKPAASIAFAMSPTHLMPPHFAGRKRTERTDERNRICAILTSSPYKTELESQGKRKKKLKEN